MIHLEEVAEGTALQEVRELFREYASSLGVDLGYQGFEEELRALPGDYAPPGGTLILARDGDGGAVGCVGVRWFQQGVAEMKRLYVRTSGRGMGAGRQLAEAAVSFAHGAGYWSIRLDTLPQMQSAQALYRNMGFREINAYRYSAVPGTTFMELDLATERL